MTSVNSPACLLACNRFYRHLSPSPEQMKPVISSQKDSVRHKQRQVILCVTMASPPGFSGGGGNRGLWVDIVLGSSSALQFSSSKPTRPADRGVK